jgi:uncharacterized membrane protein YfhO
MKVLSKENRTLNKRNGKLAQFIDNNIYVGLAFLCSTVLMLLVYYTYEIIPFGGRTVLRMDLFHQYGPLFAELVDRISEGKSLLYSWTTGGGGSFIGNYYNYLSSPIGLLIALIAGHENIPESIGAMVLIKNALAASAFAYYIKNSTGKNNFSISAFGIMYAFCGFFIAYYWNIMWIDAMYLLPLIVLGIEKMIKERKCAIYIFSLAFSFFANYYMTYMICIFAVLYFLVYFISNNRFSDTYDDIPKFINNDGKEESGIVAKITYNKFLRSGCYFAFSSAISAMLIAFALIPTFLCLRACSATSGTFPENPTFYNSIFDFIANHLAAVEPTIRSSGDTVLPNVYCGIAAVILLPLYVFCDKIKAKEKAMHIILLALFFVGFNLNFANYILHAMHFPNDLPFRFSFLYSFLLLIMTYKVVINIRSIPLKGILGSGLGVLIMTILVQEIGMGNVDDDTIYISIAFTAIYTLVFSLMRKKELAESAVSLLLMCCVFAEVAIADIDHIKITQEKVNFTNGYTDFRELKDSLDTLEDDDTYRMEITKSNTIMDPSWFNYNGISVFSSMAYEKSANLQDKLGLDSNYINSYIYYSQTPIYNAMMSLKYLVDNDDMNINDSFYDLTLSKGKFTAYKNKYYMPIAYCVDEKMTDFNMDYPSPFEVQNDFWFYATGLYGALKSVGVTEYYTDNIYDNGNDFYDESFNYTKENSDAEGTITLKYEIPEEANAYVYLKGSTIKKINVSKETEEFSVSQDLGEPYVLDCGKCVEGEYLTVEIPIEASKDSGYVECYVAYLDQSVLDTGYSILQPGTMNIEQFDETYIKGTVTAENNQILYTSINYDDGWKVKVDGKDAKKLKIGDALIAVKLDEGTHTVEFEYEPGGLVIGCIISAGTLFLIIIFFAISRVVNKNKKPVKAEHKSKSAKAEIQTEESKAPTGIDKMMAEDYGDDVTVEQAEALLEPIDEYEARLETNAPTLSKADELLSTHKLNLADILGAVNSENSDDEEDN